MIPKTIHYCWFGRNPLPKSAIRCIESWKKFFPDYEIKEWNEDNFDVYQIPYTAEAYESKKYAFVSDFARFKILYENGGLYFDTDVEVIKSFDEIIRKGAFMGFEINPSSKKYGMVAPGLGLGVEASNNIYKEIIEFYKKIHFVDKEGKYNLKTVVEYTTNILNKNGLKMAIGIQNIGGIYIYPKDFFNPYDDATGRLFKSENTHSIHWYDKSWIEGRSKIYDICSKLLHRLIGTKSSSRLKKIFDR